MIQPQLQGGCDVDPLPLESHWNACARKTKISSSLSQSQFRFRELPWAAVSGSVAVFGTTLGIYLGKLVGSLHSNEKYVLDCPEF